MAATKTKDKEVKVTFSDLDDDRVKAVFANGSGPEFEVVLKNMTWGLVEDIDRIQDMEDGKQTAILAFFREYIEGGPKAIPFKHTSTVFKAITGYMEHATAEQTKN